MIEPEGKSIPAHVYDAAGEWLVRRKGDANPVTEHAFAAWLVADPRHRAAYEQVTRDWHDSLRLVDKDVGRARKLGRAPFYLRHSTHAGVVSLGLAAILGLGTVELASHNVSFGLFSPAGATTYQTAVGEIRTFRLEDGSQITLDTATLVRVSLSAEGRSLSLHRGRARFRVAPDNARPFAVSIAGGEILARNTVFDVNIVGDRSTVSILSGSLDLHRSVKGERGASQTLAAGTEVTTGGASGPQPIAVAELQWTSGMMTLDATPLGIAVAAINRYNHRQIQLSDPGLAQLSITGAFRARDPDNFARAVAATFALHIDRSDPGTISLIRAGGGSSPLR